MCPILCIPALNFANNNCVTVLTFPPHSTGKLQPLDVGVFGPFEEAYKRGGRQLVDSQPCKTFFIYDVAGCVNEAHIKTMIPSSICSAIKAIGIFPFNRDIFTDNDFAPSYVTYRQPGNEIEVPDNINEEQNHTDNVDDEDRVTTGTPSRSVLLPSDQIDSLAKFSHHSYEDFVLPTVEGV